ncbi:HAD-IA family hydrolase [Winogradskyella sp. 3972H.M.0a.05]|uniref:HAD family hydrolase n=1 Tax=Winogradskyella sp. 3972H.M.0a.05 TaxID=2950277 RepID=UPI0033952205
MIKTLIFDFGDVFINLDKQGTIERTKTLFGFDIITEKPEAANKSIFKVNDDYERGFISTEEFLSFYSDLSNDVTKEQVKKVWNSLIKDFPEYRLEFIQKLKAEGKYKLLLLSNTNDLHIDYIKAHVPFYEAFKSCFDKFYLSQEIGYRKPNADIYEFVLRDNDLIANECFFVDDTKQNTDAAAALGILTWNIDETSEDVIDMFTINADLF